MVLLLVKFYLAETIDDTRIYHYFVEGREDREYGIIKILANEMDAEIQRVAPDDFQRWIPVEEINELRNSVNKRRIEDGEPELTEDEWPIATEGYLETMYADHAIKRIIEALEQGEVLEKGIAAWY